MIDDHPAAGRLPGAPLHAINPPIMSLMLQLLASLRRYRRPFRTACGAGWFVAWLVVAYLMLDPGLSPPGRMNDKVAHCLLYAIVTGSAASFVDRRRAFLPTAALAFLLSAIFEGLQHWVPGRSAGLDDLAANATGVLIGTGLGLVWIELCRRADRLRLSPSIGG